MQVFRYQTKRDRVTIKTSHLIKTQTKCYIKIVGLFLNSHSVALKRQHSKESDEIQS